MDTAKAPASHRRLRTLLIDDDPAIRQALAVELGHAGHEVTLAEDGQCGLEALVQGEFDAVLLDMRLPDRDGLDVLRDIARRAPDLAVVILTAHGDIPTAVESIRRGAFDYLSKPASLTELEAALHRAAEHTRLRQHNRALSERVAGQAPGVCSLVGRSSALEALRATIARIAPTDVPVLISGESGTGKEIVARSLIAQSLRADQPLFTINCAALPPTLIESELFGHERGAFTGADRANPGFFELADGGTVFLDEIAEMPTGLQAKLLRVLQFGEYQRVGGRRTLTTDVRTIAATNRDLEAEIAAGTFRDDLYHRLCVIHLEIPPLRERPDDIEPLIDFVLAQRLPRGITTPQVTGEARALLRAHRWPGNGRELENVLTRAAILCQGGNITPDDLPAPIRASAAPTTPAPPSTQADMTLDEIERRHILEMLRRCGGNKAEAARRLGITKRTLYNKLILYGEHIPGTSTAES
jgi:two-component system response regulator HydG